ncbi:hypothetical protein Trco_003486 [Trichoderma cornu-damae]|uniref:2EXR domain-containing protein n=1 Tax=Trichoderma cornu-damae TaxID=654480 RepID=A0A9P8QQ56_9HYPO|nr:hypothetical protein Trco_003486 [Trichoderma cornu-damae]
MDPDPSSRSARGATPTQPGPGHGSPRRESASSGSFREIQDMMERVQRIQLLQERRIAELERQLESHGSGGAEFHLFSRLPPELRCRIWELAIPSQIFRPFRFLQPSFLEWKSLAPPAVSRVCREARHVAHRHGALYRHEFLAPVAWTWFDGRRDTLDLSPYYLAGDGFIPLQARLLREARAVMLDVGLVDGPAVAGLFGKGSRLANVDTIHLMAGSTFQVERQSWHPHAVARLFGDRSFALVDIEDGRELERLERILDMAAEAGGSLMGKWHRDAIARLRAQVRPPAAGMEAWEEARRLVVRGWMSHRGGALPQPGDCFGEDGSMDEGEVRKSYPRMPTVRLVQAFELAPVPQLARWYREEGRRMAEDVRG